jgi:hypothetical protein
VMAFEGSYVARSSRCPFRLPGALRNAGGGVSLGAMSSTHGGVPPDACMSSDPTVRPDGSETLAARGVPPALTPDLRSHRPG